MPVELKDSEKAAKDAELPGQPADVAAAGTADVLADSVDYESPVVELQAVNVCPSNCY